ncbi:MAG: sodium-dependent transporter [Eubacteriales bacterium]|nr:sodium-dependent transporter [Eubacteriales bacterium]
MNRDQFSSRLGFILACIGSAVGMGNIWRFPIMISMWGGLNFLIPYALCVLLIAATGVIAEFALGRSTEGGPIKAFGVCANERFGSSLIGRIFGVIPILGSMALAIGYTVVMGWIIKYTFLALSGRLHALGGDMDQIGATFGQTATSNATWIIVAGLASLIIMVFGVSNGIEKANKVMMPLLFFLMLGLTIYVQSLSGARDGYRYIFTLNPEALKNPLLWLFAFGQAFFSLSIAGNGSVIYGSYLPKTENLPASARHVAFFDTLSALLAAFLIIPAMAAGGAELNEGGPGLMFIYLVRVLNQMPGGLIVGMIFYVCVFFAGLSSIINLYEAPVATLQQELKLSRVISTTVILVGGVIAAILIQAITEGWMNVVSIYICPIGALLAAIFFTWVAGKSFVNRAVNQGRSKPLGAWYFPLTKYIYCALCLLALIAGAIKGGIG